MRELRSAFDRAEGNIIVLYADNPLVTPTTIAAITTKLDEGSDIVAVGFEPKDPTGYGRFLTANGKLACHSRA